MNQLTLMKIQPALELAIELRRRYNLAGLWVNGEQFVNSQRISVDDFEHVPIERVGVTVNGRHVPYLSALGRVFGNLERVVRLQEHRLLIVDVSDGDDNLETSHTSNS